MEITGIICEYNPFHLGHARQISLLRERFPQGAIVCLMSGDFVQRGMPAIVSKDLRAKAAVEAGADLVLELPVTGSLRSAEGFAGEGVRILSPWCDHLCFGAETADPAALTEAARALLSETFRSRLREQLNAGLSFPSARQKALEAMGIDPVLVATPNNILAVEYCKAILSQKSPMKILPIHRPGSYHATAPDSENPSATAVRTAMEKDAPWQDYVPEAAANFMAKAPLHTLKNGEKAILARLRTMTDEEFEALPYGSEGLWRKLMHASRREATLDGILEATKSKRYTRSRLDRMVMCAFLGITRTQLEAPAPYTRVLALNDRGREVLKLARQHGDFPNIGEVREEPYQRLEDRCSDLYGLFSPTPEAPGANRKLRVFFK